MYNPQKVEMIKKPSPGTIIDGIIIAIQDGTVKDFLKVDSTKFKNTDSPCINVVVESKLDTRNFKIEQIFTYIKSAGDTTLFTSDSNLGKYYKSYGKLPEVGDKVKMMSNSEGFFKIMV